MKEVPSCALCEEDVEKEDVVFESLCGHDGCPSMPFHPLCLMKWRDTRDEINHEVDKAKKRFDQFVDRMNELFGDS